MSDHPITITSLSADDLVRHLAELGALAACLRA